MNTKSCQVQESDHCEVVNVGFRVGLSVRPCSRAGVRHVITVQMLTIQAS